MKTQRRSLVLGSFVLTALTLSLGGCATLRCGDSAPSGKPRIEGSIGLDPGSMRAIASVQVGLGLPERSSGTVELWVGADPGDEQPRFEKYHFDRLPWTSPPGILVWNIDRADADDALVAVRLQVDRKPALIAAKYFEMPDQAFFWRFRAPLVPMPEIDQEQGGIGGLPGSDNEPLVGVESGQEGTQLTFSDAEVHGPTHGWRPKRMWVWRLVSDTRPAFDKRDMHVDDAFWSIADVPPLPYAFPTALNGVDPSEMACSSGEKLWVYAIIEEIKDRQRQFRAHVGTKSDLTCTPTAPAPYELESGNPTANGPAGS